MEVVSEFNNELSTLYEFKPPISKAKMTNITKLAIKGIKFYKHIVQSVEKFIQKCRPEYKVPGLYVIDSIVRQSRHQFGSEKDVFAPRFLKNINGTFNNLFKCPPEDRSKIVRVLNLWQKNSVFSIEVIQPLLDLANPNVSIPENSTPPLPEPKNNHDDGWSNWNQNSSESFNNNNSQQPPTEEGRQQSSYPNLDPHLLLQLQQQLSAGVNALENSSHHTGQDASVKFDKKLLDFDYGEEEEDEEEKRDENPALESSTLALNMAQNLLNNPELLRQLQKMHFPQPSVQDSQQVNSSNDFNAPLPPEKTPEAPMEPPSHFNSSIPSYIGSLQDDSYSSQTRMDVPAPAFGIHSSVNEDSDFHRDNVNLPPQDLDERILPLVSDMDHGHEGMKDMRSGRDRSPSPPRSSRNRSRRQRTRSRSPIRSKRRSRSDSRSRRRRHSRSRSRDKKRDREREREIEREQLMERKNRGLNPIKKNHMGVYSTTLWLGHLSKLASEADLSDAFGEYGQIISIDMIPPRGCAFICMARRQDATRALNKLRNLKLHGSVIKMAWAPGKGVKEKEYKDYWDVDSGVTQIPFDKLKPSVDLDNLEEGGMVDEDSAPEFIKEMMKGKNEKSKSMNDSHLSHLKEQSNLMAAAVAAPSVMSMMVPPFGMSMAGMVMPSMGVPMGVPPPSPLMMVNQQSLMGAMIPSGPVSMLQPQLMQPLSKTSPLTTPTTEDDQNTQVANIPLPPVSMGMPSMAAVSQAMFHNLYSPALRPPMVSWPISKSAQESPAKNSTPNNNFSFPPNFMNQTNSVPILAIPEAFPAPLNDSPFKGKPPYQRSFSSKSSDNHSDIHDKGSNKGYSSQYGPPDSNYMHHDDHLGPPPEKKPKRGILPHPVQPPAPHSIQESNRDMYPPDYHLRESDYPKEYPPSRDDYPPPRNDYPPPRDDYPPPRDDYPPPSRQYPPRGGDYYPNSGPDYDMGELPPPEFPPPRRGRGGRGGSRGSFRGRREPLIGAPPPMPYNHDPYGPPEWDPMWRGTQRDNDMPPSRWEWDAYEERWPPHPPPHDDYGMPPPHPNDFPREEFPEYRERRNNFPPSNNQERVNSKPPRRNSRWNRDDTAAKETTPVPVPITDEEQKPLAEEQPPNTTSDEMKVPLIPEIIEAPPTLDTQSEQLEQEPPPPSSVNGDFPPSESISPPPPQEQQQQPQSPKEIVSES